MTRFSSLLRGVRGIGTKIMEKYNVVFVLGAPGSGKGTLSSKIVQEFGYTHLSTGDILRADDSQEVKDMMRECVRTGTMVPVEVSLGLLEKTMKTIREADRTKNNFIIDGFPRNLDNRLGWERLMVDKARISFVLFLDCSQQTCIDRCLSRGVSGSGRSDDNMDILKIRMKTYFDMTMPIIDHYDRMGLTRRVDANGSVDKVYSDVRKLFLVGDQPEPRS